MKSTENCVFGYVYWRKKVKIMDNTQEELSSLLLTNPKTE